MSKNKTPAIPGLKRALHRAITLPFSTKITGRNLGAVSQIASKLAEGTGNPVIMKVKFRADGSLEYVYVNGAKMQPGTYLLLSAQSNALVNQPAVTFDKHFQEHELL